MTSGCHRRFKAAVSQPNPLRAPVDTLRVSVPVTIITGDHELEIPRDQGWSPGMRIMHKERYPLHNVAVFTVVSRDRLRFHVQVEHKWREYADVTRYKAVLIDDQGHVYKPEAVEKTLQEHVVKMWDYDTVSVRRMYGNVGPITQIRNDGYKRRNPLGNLSVFRGRADFVFYRRNIFTPDIKRLTLLVGRADVSFQFTWNFRDEQDHTAPPGQRPTTAHHAPR